MTDRTPRDSRLRAGQAAQGYPPTYATEYGGPPNPWSELPAEPPFVLPRDRPYIDAWNRGRGRDPRFRLHEEIMPEPFAGRRDAPVVVLGRNPGWRDSLARMPSDYEDAVRGNLSDDPVRHAHHSLLTRFHATSEYWWTKRWREVQQASGLTWDELAHEVLAIEWYAYFSPRYHTGMPKLPSQDYSFYLVRLAIKRRAVIVITYGLSDWKRQVPELSTYPRVCERVNSQSAYVSRGNMPHCFDDVVAGVLE